MSIRECTKQGLSSLLLAAAILMAIADSCWSQCSLSLTQIGDADGPVWATVGHQFDPDGQDAPLLVVAGEFTSISGVSANRVAVYSGTAWSALGGGIGSSTVYAIASYDPDGDGPLAPQLVAGGDFSCANLTGSSCTGATTVNRLARWSGDATTGTWVALVGSGSNVGVDSQVLSLLVADLDGQGGDLPRLFIGGSFDKLTGASTNTPGLLRHFWNGSAFVTQSIGIMSTSTEVRAMLDHIPYGGSERLLYVGGDLFVNSGATATNLASFNGTSWDGEFDEYYVRSIGEYDPAGGTNFELFVSTDIPEDCPDPIGIACIECAASTTNLDRAFGSEGGVEVVIGYDFDGYGNDVPYLVAAGSISVHDGMTPCGLESLCVDEPPSHAGDSSSGALRWEGTAWSNAPSCGLFTGGYAAMNTFDHDGTTLTAPRLIVCDTLGKVFEYTLGGSAPSITSQPQSLTINSASPVCNSSSAWSFTLAVTASGSGLTYQWYRNGHPVQNESGHISGATSATLSVSPAGVDDVGSYWVEVSTTTGCASVRSNVVAVDHCFGDADGDGDIDSADTTRVLASWGANYSPGSGCGDADGNGVIDYGDVTATLTYGTCP